MESSRKASVWKRIGDTLQLYGEGMDYGIFDIVEVQAKRLKILEENVAALQAEIELLKGNSGS